MHPSLRHALTLTAIQCLALSPSNAAEYEFFETLPLVLSGSRLPQSLPDAPGAVTVIDADRIAATGYRDLARVLRLVPGFQLAQERGGKHWVTYHGLGMDVPQQMQVIVDGRPSPSAHFNQLPERILLQDIERIEVLRGSNSAAYGSNAFHGAVNITTRHSASLVKTLADNPAQVTDTQASTSTSTASATQLTASLWHEPGLGRSGWLLRAQRNFLPRASLPLTAWGEYEHSSQNAPGALRSGVQASAALAPNWQLQSLLQIQTDTAGYSTLLKNNAPRRLFSLQAELEYRWPQPLLGGQASASAYAARRWSNLPLFAWQDHGLRLAWLRQW